MSTHDGPLVVTGAEHGRLRRWDLGGNPAGADLTGHGAKVDDLAAASSTLVSSGRDGVWCWDAATGAPVGKKLPMATFGLAAVRLPDGRLRLAAGSDDGFLLGDPLAGTVVEIAGERISDVAAGGLPSGRAFFAGACNDGRVRLIDPATGKSTGLAGGRAGLAGLPGEAYAVAADATTVAAAGEHGLIRRWNAATGERLGEAIVASDCCITGLRFHRLVDGRLLLISHDDVGVVRRWDAGTGAEFGEPLQAGGEAGAPFDPAAANTDHLLAVADGNIVRCWDVRTGVHLGDITEAASAVTQDLLLPVVPVNPRGLWSSRGLYDRSIKRSGVGGWSSRRTRYSPDRSAY
ncbi:WD40 repeat domain-containing protein [Actinoplanes sp. NPDC051343]|uniref:WD40 repeat domain-containing protein n=1 Tax=Actinoplanes sp. NPDC051343 TaxID=3363906 RepID=UPI00378CD9F9